jgi:hypothetical protein
MNKNRIRGLRWRASGHMTAKPISIKLTGGKSGGCASKAVELTSGDLRHVTESRLRVKRFILIVSQKSAEGKVGHAVGKASEALQCRKAEQQIG